MKMNSFFASKKLRNSSSVLSLISVTPSRSRASSQLVSGVPMARVLFTGPEIGAALLPVMIFHQMQLMLGAWLARRHGEDPK